jgi:hypothetical protein
VHGTTNGHRPLDARNLARIRATLARANPARALAIDRIARACDADDLAAQGDRNNVLADRHRMPDLGELLRADRSPGPEAADDSEATGGDLEPRISVSLPPLIDLIDTETVSQLTGTSSSTLCSWRRRGNGAGVYQSFMGQRSITTSPTWRCGSQARAGPLGGRRGFELVVRNGDVEIVRSSEAPARAREERSTTIGDRDYGDQPHRRAIDDVERDRSR